MEIQFITGTVWIHRRTGKARIVAGVDDLTGSVTLRRPNGDEMLVTPGQLENLYTETESPEILAEFDNAEPAEVFTTRTATLSIGRLSMEIETPGFVPTLKRTAFGNGSTRARI